MELTPLSLPSQASVTLQMKRMPCPYYFSSGYQQPIQGQVLQNGNVAHCLYEAKNHVPFDVGKVDRQQGGSKIQRNLAKCNPGTPRNSLSLFQTPSSLSQDQMAAERRETLHHRDFGLKPVFMQETRGPPTRDEKAGWLHCFELLGSFTG